MTPNSQNTGKTFQQIAQENEVFYLWGQEKYASIAHWLSNSTINTVWTISWVHITHSKFTMNIHLNTRFICSFLKIFCRYVCFIRNQDRISLSGFRLTVPSSHSGSVTALLIISNLLWLDSFNIIYGMDILMWYVMWKSSFPHLNV
jgi:hypothetical protein